MNSEGKEGMVSDPGSKSRRATSSLGKVLCTLTHCSGIRLIAEEAVVIFDLRVGDDQLRSGQVIRTDMP